MVACAVDDACDSFLSAFDLFGDIASISDSDESMVNDGLDDLMSSDGEEDPNVDCSAGVNTSTEAVVVINSNVNDKNVNTSTESEVINNPNVNDKNVSVNDETVVHVNAVSNHAVPVSTHDAPANVNVSDKDVSKSTHSVGNDGNPINVNVVMDGIDSVASGKAAGGSMDCNAVSDRQVTVVEDGKVIEVIEAVSGGSSAMDVVSEAEAGSSQLSSSAGLVESACSRKNAQIQPSSQEEVSQSVLLPVEGWLADPTSSGPQRKARAKSSR